MECPKCKTKMEKGTLISGGLWAPRVVTYFKGLFYRDSKKVFAWSCPKCGYVELQSELK